MLAATFAKAQTRILSRTDIDTATVRNSPGGVPTVATGKLRRDFFAILLQPVWVFCPVVVPRLKRVYLRQLDPAELGRYPRGRVDDPP